MCREHLIKLQQSLYKAFGCLLMAYVLLVSSTSHADIVVDKVYKPNILPFERDVEWRLVSRQTDDGNELFHRVGYGHAFTEGFMVEVFLSAERDEQENLSLAEYEVEARWMFGEQGQYWADTAVIFELEKSHKVDKYKTSMGVINEKQFGRTHLATNLIVKYVFGQAVDSVLESEFRMQYRYRLRQAFQPALELYADKDFLGIGPGFMGVKKFSPRQQLKWELAFIKGFNGDSKDHTLRAGLQWSF
ncbi:MAG: hypothetical protein P8J70_06310 [Glaciecola sp.]|nr:hypothetical protein [Glaciecola sp.]MDG2099275.1 hypothetical protein [Glaciecola sp.]